MTPNDIEVLLWYHCRADAHPRCHAPAVQAAIQDFYRAGLLTPRLGTQVGGPGCYTTTEAGKALVEKLCRVALPAEPVARISNQALQPQTATLTNDEMLHLAEHDYTLRQWPAWMGPYPRVCAPWSKAEERELAAGHHAGLTVKQLCTKHGRQPGGINSRLHKLFPDYVNPEYEAVCVAEELAALQQEQDREWATLQRRINRIGEKITAKATRLAALRRAAGKGEE